MKKTPQVNHLPVKKSTLTGSKTVDVILGFLGGVGILFSPLLFGSSSVILAVLLVILALTLAKVNGFKYLFYGILGFASIAGIVLGGCVLILLNLDL